MDLDVSRIPAPLAWAAVAPAVALLAVLIRRLGVRAIGAALSRHVPLGATVAVLVIWQLRAAVEPAPAVHLLGAALLALMLGPALGALAMLLVVLAASANGAGDWSCVALNWLLLGALPAGVTALGLRLARTRLPDNPFVYILVCGFAGGGLSMAAVGAASGVLLVLATPLELSTVAASYWSAYLLLLFPEAFLTGAAVAWMSMFYPELVSTYSDPEPRAG